MSDRTRRLVIGQSRKSHKNGGSFIHSTNTFRESREPQALSPFWCCDVFLNLFSFDSLHRQNTRRPVRFPVTAAFLCGSCKQSPEEEDWGGVRVELRMRLPAVQGKGGGAPVNGWLLCKSGFWLLLAKAARPRGAAAGGQVRGFKPPVEKSPMALPRPHMERSRVALTKGIWGRGYRATGLVRGLLSK